MRCRLIRFWALLAVAAFALSAQVPTPEKYFGHRMGADRTVLDWQRVVSYFNALAAASDRVRAEEYGRSTEGRPMIVAVIAAPETLQNLETYRNIQHRLADPRATPLADVEALVRQGKAVVMITCAIHSTEIASTHTAVEFAYRMAVDNSPKTRAILDNTIFLLVPSLNPDGLDLVTRWYRKTLGTPYEGSSPPELYQKYTGHDNNRDWYIFSQAETRATVAALHNQWRPQIVYDVHQMGPTTARMFVPPWIDPFDPNIHPLLVQMCNAFGSGMAMDMTAAGLTGVLVNAIYDFWTPARHYQAYHGGMRLLSESASVRIATPVDIQSEQLDYASRGYNPAQRAWNHVQPWPGGKWTLRDIVDYQLVAFESALYQAALRREDLLRNFYRVLNDAVQTKTPYAFLVPLRQADPGAARVLLQTLAFGDVEIERTVEAFQRDGKSYPAGAYLIRMQQPFSSFAKTLLERQNYPDLRLYPGGPPKRPYDVTAHTLPLLMGVTVETVEDVIPAKLERAHRFEFPPAAPQGSLAASDTNTWRAVNEAWSAGAQVWRNRDTGDFRTGAAPGAPFVEVRQPRVALYQSHVPSMDEGWTRWLFDEFGFAYSRLRNQDIRPRLNAKFDVLVIPDQSIRSIVEGYAAGEMPPEYAGGLNGPGIQALQEFVRGGGTLILLNGSTALAQRLGINARSALANLPETEFYSPGSLLNVTVARHPLTYGLPSRIAIWSEQSPAWQRNAAAVTQSPLRYPNSGILASGWLLGDKHLAGLSALQDLPLGKGRVLLFGMRPQYRAQSYQAFKLFFNALLYHR